MNGLISKLRMEIENNGTLPFARFMEWALYDADAGYYQRQNVVGRDGDFFTSVSVGNLFGELLGFQFAQWFGEHVAQKSDPERTHLRIIEAGAHDGQLASDVLKYLKQYHPRLFERLEYCLLEPSVHRLRWQQKTLADFSQNVLWFKDWTDLAKSKSSSSSFTIVFSNELFDAMPVHRLGWDANKKAWFEWGVNCDGNNFAWKRLPRIQQEVSLPTIPDELREVLPEGFIAEVCPAATLWWTEAAKILEPGKMVAIDYGLLTEEFFVPERSNGTLRAYFQHHANLDLLARPGEQDLTAHVNFTALKNAGELTGLRTEMLGAQSKFLTGIAAQTWAQPALFSEWDGSRRKQFQTLTHPEHLGRPFRVLIQSG